VGTGRKGGDPDALLALGILFQSGQGVPRNLVKAHILFNLASFRGNPDGAQAQDSIENLMSATDLRRAKARTLEMVENRQYLPAEIEQLANGSPKPTGGAPRAAKPPTTASQARIDVQYACEFEPRYDDRGSGGKGDLSTFAPVVPAEYTAIGGYAQADHQLPHGCVLVVRATGTTSQGHRLVAPPLGWQKLWSDKGSGAKMDGSLWGATPPGPDYVCLGAVG